MKNKSLIILAALVAMFITSCHEITVKTTINEDGSFTRTIIVRGDDSSSVFNAALPYPIDATWEQSLEVDTTTKNKPYTLTYTRHFTKGTDLNKTLQSDTSWKNPLEKNIDIKKRNGFFYSYLVFSETIKESNPYTDLDYTDYLSQEDIAMISGTVNLISAIDSTRYEEADKKAELFLIESITYDIEKTLKEGIKQLNLASLSFGDVELYLDSIAFKVEELESEQNDVFIDYLAGWTDNPDYLKLKEIQPPLFEESNKRLKHFLQILTLDSYKQMVELPGLLTKTNSINTIGNQVNWKVEPISFIFEDYTMYAESRVVNYWAFILSGIVLVLLVVTLSVRAFRKKG